MTNTIKPRFLPGTTFNTGGRHPKLCTVTDILTTYNLAGDAIKQRYVATHEFLGQTVPDYDVCETTIARGVVKAVLPEPAPAEA
jgi:hypothetical protein